MSELKSQQDYWNSRAKSWQNHQEPLIPNAQELEFQKNLLVEGGDTLILGVTPQLCELARDVAGSVTAVDYAEELIKKLAMDRVDYVMQDWLEFLENGSQKYDNILADGSLLSLDFPTSWLKIADLIYDRLHVGGIFSPKVYVTTGKPPLESYQNPSLMRFVSSMSAVDENWQVQINSHPDYQGYDVRYTFPPKSVVLETFSKFELKDELVPDFEEGERFLSLAFRKK